MAEADALDLRVRVRRDRTRTVRLFRTLRRLLPLAPALIVIAVFLLGPILATVYLAFTNLTLSGPRARGWSFTALENFQRLFADAAFHHSVQVTVYFLVASGLGQVALGFLLALLLQRRSVVTRAIVGAVVVAAWVLPEIVAAFLWFVFLNDGGGLHAFLSGLGIDTGNWLFTHPMESVILANIHRGTAFSMLVIAAALTSLPPEVSEAAALDGAGPLRRLVHVTLPLIKGSLVTTLILVTLQTLGVFTLVFSMTNGGPGAESQILSIYMYERGLQFGELGYATAIGLIVLLAGALASLLYVRMLRTDT